jgi:hypothetical protein
MKVEFNLKDFENDKHWLLRTLSVLKRKNKFKRTKESDEFFVKSPALAFKYVESLVSEYKGYDIRSDKTIYKNTRINRLSPELEKVFSRSPKYALKYLIITNQKRFKDNNLNEKFTNKLYSQPFLSFVYSSRILGERIPFDKEEVFLKDYNALYQYAKQIIKGRFEEKLHNKILKK